VTRLKLLAVCAGITAGCASANPRPSFVDVQKNVADRGGVQPTWVRQDERASVEAKVRELLKDELSAGRAVEIALLNNPSLQATFEDIGVSQADLAQASRIANPELSGLWRRSDSESGTNTEFAVVQDVFDILMQPLRKKAARAELEQTKLRVSAEVLELASEVRAAHLTLQARQQLVKRLRLVLDITQTAADFARRQWEAGTIGQLELESQTALHRQSKVEVTLLEAEVRADRERLNRLLGLWGPDTAWRVADQLPEIPKQEAPMDGLESLAVSRRYDLQAARWGVDAVGRALSLKKGTRFFPVGIHVGVNTEKELSGTRLTGPELVLQFPIFDLGGASIARLEAEHRRAQRQLEALAVNARSEVREARDRMLTARELALYYGEVLLPQRALILDLTMRHYNMMLKGVYDLLLAKKEEVEAEKAHVEAWRDYWIARAELELAVGGTLSAPQSAEAKGGAAW
jgi:cobalt-zinc-cadmium efflux system outer membrane protein